MRKIAATCQGECGEVALQASDVELWVSRSRPECSHYTFTCPDCAEVWTYPAPIETQSKLREAKVPEFDYEPPAELFDDDARNAGGAPIGWDDVLDLTNAIEKYNATGEGVPWTAT
jgi:hypothetical protein